MHFSAEAFAHVHHGNYSRGSARSWRSGEAVRAAGIDGGTQGLTVASSGRHWASASANPEHEGKAVNVPCATFTSLAPAPPWIGHRHLHEAGRCVDIGIDHFIGTATSMKQVSLRSHSHHSLS